MKKKMKKFSCGEYDAISLKYFSVKIKYAMFKTVKKL